MIIWKTPVIPKLKEALKRFDGPNDEITISLWKVGMVDVLWQHRCACGCGLSRSILRRFPRRAWEKWTSGYISDELYDAMAHEVKKHLSDNKHPLMDMIPFCDFPARHINSR